MILNHKTLMNMQRTMLLLSLFGISYCALAETYSECILENMKNVGSQGAANAITAACRKKALPHVPAKCRPLAESSGVYNSLSHPYFKCTNDCLDASFWSKTFGECKP